MNAAVLEKLLDNGLMPVVSPLSADRAGTLLNINADTVAAAIGAALGAEKLVLCTGAPGFSSASTDPGSLISYTDITGAQAPARRGPLTRRHAAEGQGDRGRHSRRRAARARDLLQVTDSMLGEVFTNEGTGTLVVADVNALSPAEQQSAACA